MAITSRVIFLTAIVATALTGCTLSDDSAGRLLVRPDRYVLYNCTQLAKAAQATVSRQRKLEILMAKAETDSVGVLVSSAAYRPEYTKLRGLMYGMQKAAADKNFKVAAGGENLDVTVGNEPNANEPSDLDIYGLEVLSGR